MKSIRGFTLVEVLVALVIVALGMGAVLASLTSAAESTARLREKTFAAWIGFNQLASERLQASVPATGSRNGDLDYATLRWHWEETVEDVDVVPGLRRITIRVRRADDSAAQGGKGPASSAGVDWLATVVGFRGDALQSPLSELGGWDDAAANPPSQPAANPPSLPPQPPQLPATQ